MKPIPGKLSTAATLPYYQQRERIAAMADDRLRDLVRMLRTVGARNAADACARARKSVQGARNNARAHASHLARLEPTT